MTLSDSRMGNFKTLYKLYELSITFNDNFSKQQITKNNQKKWTVYGKNFWTNRYISNISFVVLSDRIAWAFSRSVSTWTLALGISKPFNRIWLAVLLHKLKFNGISCQVFGFISSFFSNRWLWVIQEKSSQEYAVNTGFSQGIILGPTLLSQLQGL